MSIEFTKDGSPNVEPIRARWKTKKDSAGQPVCLIDLHMGAKHILRAQIQASDIRALEPLSKALLELMKEEIANNRKVITPDRPEFGNIARLLH
jgi:hypothetical protein